MTSVHVWIDASAGVAGDMLLGALVDAGADLEAVRSAVLAVIPGAVRISARPVTRAGQRATKIDIEPLIDDQPDRHWTDIQDALLAADLSEPVRRRALASFEALAIAESTVHGIPQADVHFHEVGAWDSIADIVGVAAALHDLAVDTLSAGTVAVGSGRVRTAHGDLPVPVPAVVELGRGWRLESGGSGELTTPTGMALIAALCDRGEELPPLSITGSGSGAGSRDVPGRPNLTRVIIGQRAATDPPVDRGDPAVILEANVDDFDPRLWPSVLAVLLAAGAADAWLVPMIMKKGRPAHILTVLARPDQAASLRTLIMEHTSSIGVRQTSSVKFALPRGWIDLRLDQGTVSIKIAYRDGLIIQATPEFDQVEQLAGAHGLPVHRILDLCRDAMITAGLVTGAPIPTALNPAP